MTRVNPPPVIDGISTTNRLKQNLSQNPPNLIYCKISCGYGIFGFSLCLKAEGFLTKFSKFCPNWASRLLMRNVWNNFEDLAESGPALERKKLQDSNYTNGIERCSMADGIKRPSGRHLSAAIMMASVHYCVELCKQSRFDWHSRVRFLRWWK